MLLQGPLVNDPSIILADEPTGNLDSKTSYDIMDLFQELHDKGNTIIMVTHEEDIAEYSHRIIRLRDGLIESDEINKNVRCSKSGSMSAKLYTKTGDKGKTSLLGGKKVSKADLRIDAYGNVDELNSFIGHLKDHDEVENRLKQQLYWIQEHLFSIGSILATEADFKGFELPKVTPN